MRRISSHWILLSAYLFILSLLSVANGAGNAAGKKEQALEENENNDPVQRITNEETLRVIKSEVRFLLEKEVPPKLPVDKWTLVQKMKTVMSKACPETETPLFLLNAMLRLFRQMYIHSRDFNALGDRFQEKAQYLRIADALNTCGKEAKYMTFKYISVPTNPSDCITQTVVLPAGPESSDAAAGSPDASTSTAASAVSPDASSVSPDPGDAATPPPPPADEDDEVVVVTENVTYCVCEEKLKTVKIIYTKNATNPDESFLLHEKEFKLGGDLSYFLPVPNKTNEWTTRKRDLPVETLWKIFKFSHYFCAKYFRTQPADHSAMLTLMESLFNREIRYRWLNPGTRTNEVWANLFSSFDVDRFTTAVDACLAAAKAVSDYPEWIVRPSIEQFDFP